MRFDPRIAATALLAIVVLAASTAALAAGERYPYYSNSPCAERIHGTHLYQRLGPLQAEKPYRIAVLLPDTADPYWRSVKNGVQAAAKSYHLALTIRTAKEQSAAKQQREIAQALADKQFAAYVLAPAKASNLAPVLVRLKNQNAPIVNLGDARIAATTFVGPDYESEGRAAAAKLAGLFSHPSRVAGLFTAQTANVAQIEGRLSSAATIQRSEGFEKHVGQADGLNLVASVTGDGSRDKAYKATQMLIKDYPDLQGIYANDAAMAQGAVQAVAASGKKIAVVATGGGPKAIAAVRRGALAATVSALPYYSGFWAVASAVRLLQGQAVPAWVVAPAQVITEHNAHLFYDDQNRVRAGLYR